MRTVLALALLVALAGCDTASDPGAALDPATASVYDDVPDDVGAPDSFEAYRAERAALVARIDRLIGDARAGGPRACTLLPLGEKACGGPTGYRVFASDGKTAADVVRAGRRLVALDRAANRSLGLASTCDVPVAPEVRYEAGRCVASTGPAEVE